MVPDIQKHLIFKQIRIGEKGSKFTLYKFRTMYHGAHKDQLKYKHLNNGTHPAFKIEDDPRFTKIGKFLSNTGIDELLQVINISKRNMNLFGPRPLPPNEFNKLPKSWQKIRNTIKPGVISSWTIEGGHNLDAKTWRFLDERDISNIRSYQYRLILFYKFIRFFLRKIFL